MLRSSSEASPFYDPHRSFVIDTEEEEEEELDGEIDDVDFSHLADLVNRNCSAFVPIAESSPVQLSLQESNKDNDGFF